MRSHPVQSGETFDGPPTLERSGSERRGGAVSSLFPEGERVGVILEKTYCPYAYLCKLHL